jgi:predicted TIM-barrel fold metal-dependent hydrolase
MRHRFLGYRVLALLTAFLSVAVGAQEPVKAVLPIIDMHFHYMLFMTPSELMERMNKNKIAAIVSAGAIGKPGIASAWQRDAEVKAVLKERFLPAAGSSELFRLERSQGVTSFTDEENIARDDAFKQMREQMAIHRSAIPETFPNAENSSMEPMRRRRVPTDSAYFQELMKMAIEKKTPLPMHMEWHPDSVAQLGHLLTSYPQGAVVLSHCGKITVANDIRIFFEKHSNVFCDLGYRGAPLAAQESAKDPRRLIYWPASYFRKADIKPDWLQLIEDFPDRFMMAVDDVHSWAQYDETVEAIRTGVLDKLKPETAEKVAYKNAMKLYQLPPSVLSGLSSAGVAQ